MRPDVRERMDDRRLDHQQIEDDKDYSAEDRRLRTTRQIVTERYYGHPEFWRLGQLREPEWILRTSGEAGRPVDGSQRRIYGRPDAYGRPAVKNHTDVRNLRTSDARSFGRRQMVQVLIMMRRRQFSSTVKIYLCSN